MSKLNYLIALSVIVLLIVSCTKTSNNDTVSITTTTPNILLIIADDLGKDAINGYQEGSIKPNTPNIDAIRNKGLLFTNFWVNPTCTPTRASIITGKYGYRTGVKGVSNVLSSSEIVIQKHINNNTNDKYATAIVGKWHLSGNNSTFNPESFGIDYYAGLIRGAVDDYYQWQLTEDGITNLKTTYITEAFTDLAIDWVNKQSKPWFLWLAYTAPHTPFHVPPSNMHNQGNLPAYVDGMNPTPYYMAAIEAMDFQIGRFLEGIPQSERENTVIIFIGDNGTPNQVAQSPYTNATVKGTLKQGGINTPMFISGKGISRVGVDNSLLTGTDLFATISEIAGVSLSEYNDSKSFYSLFSQTNTLRKYQYAELNEGTTDAWTISNGTYKLIVKSSGSKEMYHLTNDPYEQNNLLNSALSTTEQNAKLELETELSNIRK
ncbi:MAG: sulfatase [Cytophagales bacterium]|nr:MAG: sulfatase [Cytophagales bacterium]